MKNMKLCWLMIGCMMCTGSLIAAEPENRGVRFGKEPGVRSNQTDRPKTIEDELFKAIKENKFEKVRKLVDEGADVNARMRSSDDLRGDTPLMVGAYSGASIELMEFLINSGADIHSRDVDGMTVFMHAASCSSSFESVKLLLKRGANLNSRDVKGRNALMYSVAFDSNPETVQFLIDQGPDVHARDAQGKTVLMYAARYCSSIESMKLLLDSGARVQDRIPSAHLSPVMGRTLGDIEGDTVLAQAVVYSSVPEIIELLIIKGADVHEVVNIREYQRGRNKGIHTVVSSVLTLAARGSGTPEVLTVLLEYRADPLFLDTHGKRALEYARENSALNETDEFWELNDVSYE